MSGQSIQRILCQKQEQPEASLASSMADRRYCRRRMSRFRKRPGADGQVMVDRTQRGMDKLELRDPICRAKRNNSVQMLISIPQHEGKKEHTHKTKVMLQRRSKRPPQTFAPALHPRQFYLSIGLSSSPLSLLSCLIVVVVAKSTLRKRSQ